jgi:DNA-binding NtrC family response regulator
MLATILIVDGNPEQRGKTECVIREKLKYYTLTAETGQEAMKIILSGKYAADIMLIDMRDRQGDGLKIIHSIKLHRPDFPIIIFTEYGDHSYAAKAIQAGISDYVMKPASIERLGLSLANALRICQLCGMVTKLEKKLALCSVNTGMDRGQPVPFRAGVISPYNNDGHIKKLRALEEDAIRFALNICGGSMSKAARSLGIGRSTLYRKVAEIGHDRKRSYISRENQITRPIIDISDIEHS